MRALTRIWQKTWYQLVFQGKGAGSRTIHVESMCSALNCRLSLSNMKCFALRHPGQQQVVFSGCPTKFNILDSSVVIQLSPSVSHNSESQKSASAVRVLHCSICTLHVTLFWVLWLDHSVFLNMSTCQGADQAAAVGQVHISWSKAIVSECLLDYFLNFQAAFLKKKNTLQMLSHYVCKYNLYEIKLRLGFNFFIYIRHM